jgi:hypothetical protein
MQNKVNPFEVFNKILSRNYDLSCCFLCGEDLNEDNRSLEHVFPKWLLDKYNLWDQKYFLLNQTNIPYNKLIIPCCLKCNNIFLNKIENEVKSRHDRGFESFKDIDREKLFFWLGKIFYGLLYKELSLLVDRKNPEQGYIISPTFLKQFEVHWLFLQGIIGKHSFRDFFPASIFIFKTQYSNNIELNWDFVDSTNTLSISIRMGDIGVVGVLQDGGTTEGIKNLFKDFSKVPLHHLQFRELASKIIYQSLLFNRVPKYFTSSNKGFIETIQMPIGGLSSKPLYDQGNALDYAHILSKYTEMPLQDIYSEPSQVMTWIKNEKDEITFIDINTNEKHIILSAQPQS